MSTRTILSLILLAASLWGQSAHASDILKEQRWASQLTDQLVVGEPVQIKAGAREFFAIYTPAAAAEKRGGVILLHGMGAHPDWPEVIAPLREGLPESGWATLSIQMPILDNEAEITRYIPLFPEGYERINAAIAYLQAQGIQNIVLVAHSLGAGMGAAYLAAAGPESKTVRAFVGIGMNQFTDPEAPIHTPTSLSKITIPVLDLYGELDNEGVRASAQARASAAKQAGNAAYLKVVMPGADHFFRGQETALVSRVSSWLRRVALM
jgi:pimeloyl-ACP methyl ester carboxylesterase